MKITFFLILFLLTSCTYKKINTDSKEYQDLSPIDYREIIPYKSFDCWKILYCNINIDDSIIYSSANCSNHFFKPDFNKLNMGFDNGCHPTFCFKYIISFDKESLNYWSTMDSLKMFLGSIDNISEAQFLAKGFNYFSTSESVFKQTQDEFNIILFKMVRTGNPIQIDKFLLKTFKDGRIKILGREINNRKYNAII